MVDWLDSILREALEQNDTFETRGLAITKSLLQKTDEQPLKMQYIFLRKT